MGIGVMVLAMAAVQAMAALPTGGMPPVMVTMVPPAQIEGAPLRQPEGGHWSCSSGYGDCLRIDRSGPEGRAQLLVFDMDAAAADIPAITLPPEIGSDDGMDIAVWNQAIRLPEDQVATSNIRTYLIGIIRRTPVAYSGGFASGERLHLFQLIIVESEASLGTELVSLPWTSEAQIRACFGEEDDRRRRGECHDIYRYVPSITLDDAGDGHRPVLRYTAVATAYPRTARRGEDSTTAPPLTAADLVEWRDPECSYSRTLRYNPATDRYEMDRIAPDCSSYTVP
jgi:hypothetical protein